MIIAVFVCVLLLFAGIGIKYFKWYWLIAGYNTMPAKAKEKVNIEEVAPYLGNMLILLSVIFLITLYLEHIGNTIGFISGYCIFLVMIIYMILKIQRITAKQYQTDYKTGLILLAIVALIGFASIILVLYGVQPASVEINPQYINISGIYGRRISFNRIENVSLINDIPEIEIKINGFNAGNVRKGKFKLNNIGKGIIFLEDDVGPFIFIETQSEYYIINQKDKNRTQKLYEEIIKQLHG